MALMTTMASMITVVAVIPVTAGPVRTMRSMRTMGSVSSKYINRQNAPENNYHRTESQKPVCGNIAFFIFN